MTRWNEEAPRLAKLARLELSAEEAETLARQCQAVTAEFAALSAYAAELPPAQAAATGALREDEPRPAPPSEVEGILRAVPKLDGSRAVVVPRGLP